MLNRRHLLLLSVAALGGALACPALAQSHATQPIPNDPLAITNAIYKRVSAGAGDSGGQFVWLYAKDRPRYLSKSLTALWNKVDADTPKGDEAPPGFDPITNSQDPVVKSFKASVEKQDAGSATIAVMMKRTFSGPPQTPVDDTIRFDFVRDGAHWKIDDIRGAIDGKPWSLRDMLTAG